MKRARVEDTPPLEPAEFGIAFQLAIDSGQAVAVQDDPSASATGRDQSPYQKASDALGRHFADEDEKYESAMLRFCAVMDLFAKNVLGDWMRQAGHHTGTTELHPAVLDVASRMRLARNGKFPVRRFLETVEQTAKRDYARLADWPIGED
jgi:hypothetical protein